MELWKRDKEQYRQRYYLNAPAFESPEILFGKKIAKMLENHVDHPLLRKIPRYQYPEYRIQIPVLGVPFLAVIDSFSKRLKKVLEYKTGRQKWDLVRVHKHGQLVVYSLLAKLKHGKVDPVTKLIWMETEYAPVMDTIGSFTCEREGSELSFTGKIETFERRIFEWERKQMAEEIRRTALEISEDYARFQNKL